jgi:hypothetical protein
LAENQLKVKTWCLTLLAGIAGLAASVAGLVKLTPADPRLSIATGAAVLIVGLPVLAGFAVLDAYYLHLERHFRTAAQRPRDLTARVLAGHALTGLTVADWRQALTLAGPAREPLRRVLPACLRSLALSPFYLALTTVLLAPAAALTVALIWGGAR